MNQNSESVPKEVKLLPEVQAFKAFAERELQQVFNQSIADKDISALSSYVLKAVNFEKELHKTQVNILLNLQPVYEPFYLVINDYLDGVRKRFYHLFLGKNTPSNN